MTLWLLSRLAIADCPAPVPLDRLDAYPDGPALPAAPLGPTWRHSITPRSNFRATRTRRFPVRADRRVSWEATATPHNGSRYQAPFGTTLKLYAIEMRSSSTEWG